MAAAIVALSCALALGGCFGLPAKEPAAAYVNGAEVLESDVTSYIEGFRSKNDTYGTDAGWTEFLASAGYTAGTFRTHVLDTVFIPNEIVRQECAKRNINITDDQLDMVIDQERSYYEARYGADSWDSVLASFGYDEKTWRENEELRLLEEQLTDVVVKDKTASKSEVLTLAREKGSDYNGKRSYFIAFDENAKAQEAYESLGDKASGSVRKKDFSKLGDMADAGWNSIASDRDNLSNEYLNALNAIEASCVGEPVAIDGKTYLIYCSEVFTCPSEVTYARLNAFPEAIYDQIASDASKAHVETQFMGWLDGITEKSTIAIEPMPEGLPYDTDVPLEDE